VGEVSNESKRTGPVEPAAAAATAPPDQSWMANPEGVPSLWREFPDDTTSRGNTFDPNGTNEDSPDEGEVVLDNGAHLPALAHGHGHGHGHGNSPPSSTTASGVLTNPAALLALAQSTMLTGSTSLEGSVILVINH
jgi:hypothetical protein